LNNEVIFVNEEVIKIDQNFISDMEIKARQYDSKKLRYCFHENENSDMQEMLFVMPHSGYARPHKHNEVAETHVVIDGSGICVLLDECGEIIEAFRTSREDNFIYRISKGIYHMVIPVSEQMVIYEVREGKFDSTTNCFPSWAPDTNDSEKVGLYMEAFKKRLKSVLI
jgi:cupin fold WbuC family metalloprotein